MVFSSQHFAKNALGVILMESHIGKLQFSMMMDYILFSVKIASVDGSALLGMCQCVTCMLLYCFSCSPDAITSLCRIQISLEVSYECFLLCRYEDDPIIGHRLYREIRNVEVKKGRGKNMPPIPHSSYQWEAVATNLDEFLNVSVSLDYGRFLLICFDIS